MVCCVFKIDRHTYMRTIYLNKGIWEHARGFNGVHVNTSFPRGPQAGTVGKRPGFIAKHNTGLHVRELLKEIIILEEYDIQ